jgi:tungstate transport system substrate-binding protein
MATTLRAASDQGAYTLTDRATFLQLRPRLQLEVLHEGDPRLLNTYAVIVGPGERMEDATRFAGWLAEGAGRTAIQEYRLEGGSPAFRVWPGGCPGDRPSDIPCAGSAGR